MKLKCKIFKNTDEEKLEEAVNKWLESSSVNIVAKMQSSSEYETVITIWYEP